MRNLDNVLTGLDIAWEINKNLVASSAIMGIAQAQNESNRKIRPYQNAIDAAIKANAIFDSHELGMTGILGIAQVIQKNASLAIPAHTMSAISMIARQHNALFANTSAMTAVMSSTIGLSQLNSLQVALKGISGNIARIAASTSDWEIIDDFETVSEQALEFSENPALDFHLSEETTRAFDRLVDLVIALIKKNKRAGIYSLLFIDMVLRVASLHQYYDFLKTKPEIATKEDVKKLETKLIQSIEKKLKDHNEYRITVVPSRVFLKPKTKSLLLTSLPKNHDVIILQIKHKWAYVSFIDPHDNFSQTGWVLKKYLSKINN